MDIQEKAKIVRKSFYMQAGRWLIAHDETASQLTYHAHGTMFPDDFRYRATVEALDAIIDGDEWLEPDIYTHDLLEWLNSHLGRLDYCDEAMADYGPFDSTFNILQAGQKMELDEVFSLVREWLEEWEPEEE